MPRATRGLVWAAFVASMACRGTNPGAVAADVAVASAVAVANAAAQPASPASEGSHLAADMNDPPPSRPQTLDLEHTRASLLEIDLGACWPKGAPRQPRDVQVTFRNDGTVTRVAVPAPRGIVTFDEMCVGKKLKDIIVDPFLGPDVIVGVTYGKP